MKIYDNYGRYLMLLSDESCTCAHNKPLLTAPHVQLRMKKISYFTCLERKYELQSRIWNFVKICEFFFFKINTNKKRFFIPISAQLNTVLIELSIQDTSLTLWHHLTTISARHPSHYTCMFYMEDQYFFTSYFQKK